MNIANSILLLLICGIAAFRIVNWLWPIIEQRKHLTPAQMLERALQAPAEKMEHRATIFGSRTKTLVIRLVNTILPLEWLWLSQYAPFLLWLGSGYLVAGFVVQRQIKIPRTSELSGLNIFDRVSVRIFYAWFWPAYIPYIFRRQ